MRSLLRNLVGCVSPEDGSWTRVRPLLEQGPRRCGVGPRLCLITLGQAARPRAPGDTKRFDKRPGIVELDNDTIGHTRGLFLLLLKPNLRRFNTQKMLLV